MKTWLNYVKWSGACVIKDYGSVFYGSVITGKKVRNGPTSVTTDFSK